MVIGKVRTIKCTNITARLKYLIMHLILKIPRLSRHDTNMFSYKSLTINIYSFRVCVCVCVCVCINEEE